jgi:two-component system response regulator FixJ
VNHPLRIALVDDDRAILDSLSHYLRTKGIDVECFECAESLLKSLSDGSSFDCIVSDLQMPGLTGLELQNALSALRVSTPLILITGHGDVETAVSAIKAGARDFLEKPFDEDRLIATVREAVASANRDQLTAQELADLRKRISELSDRQREVMNHAVKGLTNKEIAVALRISPSTVESHRAWVMERTGAKNVADLVRIAMRLGLTNERGSAVSD